MDFARKAELLAQKKELERELMLLEAEERKLKALPLPARVAEMMHSLHCHANHTDGCGWEYESWDKPGPCRQRAVEKAAALIARVKAHLELHLTDRVHAAALTPEMIFDTIQVCQERYW